jgi:hypothetical protein
LLRPSYVIGAVVRVRVEVRVRLVVVTCEHIRRWTVGPSAPRLCEASERRPRHNFLICGFVAATDKFMSMVE